MPDAHPLPALRPRSRCPALVLALVAVLAAMALATRSSAADEPALIASLPGMPVWLLDAGSESGGTDGEEPAAAALTVDGEIWWLSRGAATLLGTGLAADQAETCGGAIIAVDALGRLRRFVSPPAPLAPMPAGPPVSLLHRPLCLDGVHRQAGLPAGTLAVVGAGGEVLLVERDGRVRERAEGVRALPDAEPVLVDLGGGFALALLADPTQRYRNGVLGDEVEAGSVALLAIPSLREVARWSPAFPAVIEERRPTPWRAGEAVGLHVTVSSERSGARLVTLGWDGNALAERGAGPSVGRSRWLHVLAAIDSRAYAQHRPHVGGPLVRYEFDEILGHPAGSGEAVPPAPRLVESSLDVSSHVIGERQLDRATWLRTLARGVDLLALPRSDGRSVVWVRCDARACREIDETPLAARLATNLVPVGPTGEPAGLLAGDASGAVWWLPAPAAPER